MKNHLPYSLYVKSFLVGSSMEESLKKLRWIIGIRQRYRHPELWELYLEERWLPVVLQKLLARDSCGVDVGSHIGSFLSLLKKYAPQGRHIAFEASAIRAEWLKRKFSDVEVHSCAVADRTGTASFREDCDRPGFSTLQPEVCTSLRVPTVYEVPMCRLDDVLLDRKRISLIKMDIEGGELAALQGAARTIGKWKPAVIFECGPELTLEAQKVRRKELYDFIIEDLGYEVFLFADFVFSKESLTFQEFRKCGIYPFRAFNFVAMPRVR